MTTLRISSVRIGEGPLYSPGRAEDGAEVVCIPVYAILEDEVGRLWQLPHDIAGYSYTPDGCLYPISLSSVRSQVAVLLAEVLAAGKIDEDKVVPWDDPWDSIREELDYERY